MWADSPLHSAQRYLASAYDSVASLIEVTYPALRDYRGAPRGTLTHPERDVFRAAIVFAAAGLDTVVKEAIRNSLDLLVARPGAAREKYIDFVAEHVTSAKEPGTDPRVLATLLVEPDADAYLRDKYVTSLTGSSMQSQTQVTAALAALGLESKTDRELFKDAATLNPLFKARNEVAHELDMTPSAARAKGERTRRERKITDSIDLCHRGLNYAQRVLNRVQECLDED